MSGFQNVVPGSAATASENLVEMGILGYHSGPAKPDTLEVGQEILQVILRALESENYCFRPRPSQVGRDPRNQWGAACLHKRGGKWGETQRRATTPLQTAMSKKLSCFRIWSPNEVRLAGGKGTPGECGYFHKSFVVFSKEADKAGKTSCNGA